MQTNSDRLSNRPRFAGGRFVQVMLPRPKCRRLVSPTRPGRPFDPVILTGMPPVHAERLAQHFENARLVWVDAGITLRLATATSIASDSWLSPAAPRASATFFFGESAFQFGDAGLSGMNFGLGFRSIEQIFPANRVEEPQVLALQAKIQTERVAANRQGSIG